MTVSVFSPITQTAAITAPTVVFVDRPIKQMARELFDDRTYECFINLTMKESHLNPKAKNPTSGALGIAQLLPSTMKSLGFQETDNANVQLIGLIAYASRRHSSICSAWKFWQKQEAKTGTGWY